MQSSKNILISVIMSCYKSNINDLKESIESILNQRYSNFEFLIADNGEDFDLKSFLKGFNDNRIKYIKNNPIIHPALSYDKLASISKGTYIAIQDHDDISLPDRLLIEKDELDNNKNLQSVSCLIHIFGNSNYDDGVSMQPEKVEEELIFFQPIKQPTFMKRKEFCNSYKYDSNWMIYDYEFWSRTRHIPHKIINSRQLLYRKSISNSSIARSNNIRKEHCLIIQRNLKEININASMELCKMLDPFNRNKFSDKYLNEFINYKDILLKNISENLYYKKLNEIKGKII